MPSSGLPSHQQHCPSLNLPEGWGGSPALSLLSGVPRPSHPVLPSVAVSHPLASSLSFGTHRSALASRALPGRALQESLRTSSEPRGPGSPHRTPLAPAPPSFEEQLRLALELSSREQEERERRGQQEEDDLQRVLRLSLMEH